MIVIILMDLLVLLIMNLLVNDSIQVWTTILVSLPLPSHECITHVKMTETIYISPIAIQINTTMKMMTIIQMELIVTKNYANWCK